MNNKYMNNRYEFCIDINKCNLCKSLENEM